LQFGDENAVDGHAFGAALRDADMRKVGVVDGRIGEVDVVEGRVGQLDVGERGCGEVGVVDFQTLAGVDQRKCFGGRYSSLDSSTRF
jgi:hypothetical protein